MDLLRRQIGAIEEEENLVVAGDQGESLAEAGATSASQQRPVLLHFALCPHSRSIRLLLSELGIEFDVAEERPWEWRGPLLDLNPSGELPVLRLSERPVAGWYAISEYLGETCGTAGRTGAAFAPFPGDAAARAEVRRLVDWFHGKLHREVSRELLIEKVYSRSAPGPHRAPDPDMLSAARANLRYHLTYVGHLAEQRDWLAGPALSFADLAAGAQLSVADYLGEVAWDASPAAKRWYQRLKSRPAFRPLLADRLAGMPPPSVYADLDF